MKEWYRSELKTLLDELVPKWDKILKVRASNINVKLMKTNGDHATRKRVMSYLNWNLQKTIAYIEYVVAHELVHLIERLHNDNFKAHLDKHITNWKDLKAMLNEMPL